jgi:hypothetical protein
LDTSENIMLSLLGEECRQRVTEITSQIAEYIRRKYPKWDDCPDQDLRDWLVWHWCQGLVAPMLDPESGKLAALVVVRYFDEPDGYETAYLHRAHGRVCYVELALSEDPAALQAAIASLHARHGVPVYMMHERPNRGLAPKIFLWKRFGSKLENQKYGQC